MGLWMTGSYDNTARLWDIRSGQFSLILNHEAPVEDLVFSPTSSLAISASGNNVYIWDLFSGGRLIQKISNTKKSITTVRIIETKTEYSSFFLMTGCLDGSVKIYDNFKIAHTWIYPHPVLSLGVSPKLQSIAVGMAEGTLCIRGHLPSKKYTLPKINISIKSKYYLKKEIFSSPYRKNNKTLKSDQVFTRRFNLHLTAYEHWIKHFRNRDALDAALVCSIPQIFMAVLIRLATLGALEGALHKKTAKSVSLIMNTVLKCIVKPAYTTSLIKVIPILLNNYKSVSKHKSLISEHVGCKKKYF